jgi:hypothetical protein
MRNEAAIDRSALSQEGTMSLSKPMLGLAVGGVLGLLDGLSGFFEPSLGPVMGSVITFSLLKGLVAGITTGYVSERVRSMVLGILAGIGIAAVLSLLVVLRAGMALFVDIMIPGMLLGAIVGFATQRFGRKSEPAAAAR